MQVRPGDFIIGRSGKKSMLLIAKSKARSKDDYPVKAVVANELSATDAAETYELDREDVLANLGDEIEEGGSAFGCKIHPWREQINVKGWGPVQVFRSLSFKERKVLIRALKQTSLVLKKRRLDGFQPLLALHVKPKIGKWAGFYFYNTKDGDKIQLNPEEFTSAETSYIIYHEAGHGIWFRCLSERQKARWIKMYHQCVKIALINPKEVIRLRKEYINSKSPVKDFRHGLEEDGREVFDEIISWINSYHNVDKDDLNTLMTANQFGTLKRLFPTQDLFNSDVDHVVSEYGSKNVREFFAEAFSFYLTDKELPAGVVALLKKTFKRIGAN